MKKFFLKVSVSKPYRYARKGFPVPSKIEKEYKFQNLIGMLGSIQAMPLKKALQLVSKPYRYARKIGLIQYQGQDQGVSKPYRYARKKHCNKI